MKWKRAVGWAVLGTLPGLVLLVLSVPVGPDLDLLLGVGGMFLIVLGSVVGTLAGREEDPMNRKRVAGGAAAGAAIGALFFLFQPLFGAVLALVGAFLGASRARRSGGSYTAEVP